MKKNLFILTGWSVGITPLEGLAEAMRERNYNVTLCDLPYQEDPQQWLLSLGWLLPQAGCWIGWSLGGQLLSQLTQIHGEQCRGLVTLASNPLFVSTEDWPCAMPAETFEQFREDFRNAPERTRDRFDQLVAHGCADPRQLCRQLQGLPVTHNDDQLNAGLDMLAELDTRQALQGFDGPQYHLLADHDALIPMNCADKLRELLPSAQVELLENNGHGFPVQSRAPLADRIDQFIRQIP